MTIHPQEVIDAARTLSPPEQLEVVQAISQSLAHEYPYALRSAAFWASRSIEDIAGEQRTPTVTNVGALAADFWPQEESADDLLDFITAQRRAGLSPITDRMTLVQRPTELASVEEGLVH